MYIPEFLVETWMTNHENDCKYNLTDTCLYPLTIKEIEELLDINIINDMLNMPLDYGPITGSNRLKKAILSLYKSGTIDNITLTIGTINANELVMISLLEQGDEVITCIPSYQQLYSFPKSLGCKIKYIKLKEENNWIPTINDFTKLVSNNTKMIILNSPNNPTGTFIEESLMKEIITLCDEFDCYLMCDEVYRGYYNNKLTYSVSDIYKKAIVTSSLSKVLLGAGLRLGWIKASKDIIDIINYRRDYHIISTGPLNDYLGAIILEHKDIILKRSEEICNQNKEYLKEWLTTQKHLSCVIPKYGTVGFLKYNLDIDANIFCERLQKETGIFFVPGTCFDDNNHLRFGFGNNPKIVKEGLEIFSNWLKQFE